LHKRCTQIPNLNELICVVPQTHALIFLLPGYHFVS
jgi:hypothetical protein